MQLPASFEPGSLLLEAGAGALEVVVDLPGCEFRGVAIVAHPHPLQGGSAAHKIPALLAKALAETGLLVLRPNFRGVGRSSGTHDEGRGDVQDHAQLARALTARFPELPLMLVGFSFGAFVTAWTYETLRASGVPVAAVCVAGMPSGEVAGQRSYLLPKALPGALIVHGERDERAPLAAVFDWARDAAHPVLVVPGADHFFTGRLPTLRTAVLQQVTLALTS